METIRDINPFKSGQKLKRVIVVGSRGSSKTTALGCLSLAADLKSTRERNFKHFIHEKTSGIRQVPSDLCSGYFPEPTPPGLIYEADMHLVWKGTFGERSLMLPFCETAGEDMENLAGPYKSGVYSQAEDWQNADVLNKYICDSNGYILVAPVSRAHIAGVPQMDEETIGPKGRPHDPDLVLSRILAAIYAYKKKTRSPPIEGIAVLLTKYDAIENFLKSRGMNLFDPIGAQTFLSTYFRQTAGLLKFYGLEKIKFFPTFVQVEKLKQPDGSIAFAKREDGSYKIVVDTERNLPIFSEQSYYSLIDWLRDTFAS